MIHKEGVSVHTDQTLGLLRVYCKVRTVSFILTTELVDCIGCSRHTICYHAVNTSLNSLS